jgi:hypothetical protein
VYSARAAVAQVDDWLAEAGVTPPGNGVEAHLWGAGGTSEASTDEAGGAAAAAVDVSLMNPEERAEYEERKLKLRKAMVRAGGRVSGRATDIISLQQQQLMLA